MNTETALQPPLWATGPDSSASRRFIIDAFEIDMSGIQRLRSGVAASGLPVTVDRHTEQTKRVEMHIVAAAPPAWQLFQQLIPVAAECGFDISVVPGDQPAMRLLVCDMDSTIVATETLDDLAARAGIGKQVQDITVRAMRGEIDFKQALSERVELLSGMQASLLDEVATEVQCNSGADDLVRIARANGIRTVLVSGGFRPVVQHVAQQLGFDRYVCNDMELIDGKLSGRVKTPVIDAGAKLNTMLEECRQLNIEPALACSIGDGANDLPMLQAAGTGISYYGKPLLRAALPYQINVSDLTAVLPLLGIREPV